MKITAPKGHIRELNRSSGHYYFTFWLSKTRVCSVYCANILTVEVRDIAEECEKSHHTQCNKTEYDKFLHFPRPFTSIKFKDERKMFYLYHFKLYTPDPAVCGSRKSAMGNHFAILQNGSQHFYEEEVGKNSIFCQAMAGGFLPN